MPKVLLTRSRSTDPAIRKVAQALHQAGYEVTLLIWDRSGNLSPPSLESEYTIKYFHFPAPQDKMAAILYFPIWWAYEIFSIFKINPDIIHACDLDTLYPAILSKILKGQSLVYIIYDFYANNLPNGRFQRMRNIIRYFVGRSEKMGIGFADLLILADESRYQEIRGAKVKNLIYLYNTPEDLDRQKTSSYTETPKKEKILFYAGIINSIRGVRDVIIAIEEIEDIKLILAGPLIDKAMLDKTSEKLQYIGWIPTYEELIAKTSQADILFRLSDPSHPKTKFESPNKLFEAMMCGKPIIVSDHSSMANIVRQEECGLVVPYGDIDAIKRAILTLKNDPALCKRLGENGRKAYETKYSWAIMEKRLLKAYGSLLKD